MSIRTGTALDAPAPVESRKERQTLASSIEHGDKIQTREQGRHDIEVQLMYLRDDPLYDSVKPLQVTPPFLDLEGKTNIQLDAGPTEILNDVRGREHEFTLDGNGFQYIHAPTEFNSWYSQPEIGAQYLPEMERLLRREVEGCDEIVFYDARLRRDGDTGAREKGVSFNPFAKQVHLDNTEKSVIEKVRNFTDMKADFYLAGRVRMINIWRPVHHPVYDCGLAIADGSKLRPGDVIECDRVRSDTGQYWDTMGVVKYKPHFDWYYRSLQDQSDVLIFKNYDSAKDVPARTCMHTAFDVPENEIPTHAPPRQSIEVRALVFTLPGHKRRPSGPIMQRPLESALAQGSHTLFEEEHSITHYLRTDIDEGKEVKDAILLVRKQAQLRLARACEAYQEERDMAVAQREQALTERDKDRRALRESEMQLQQSRQQISILTGNVEALESKVADLERQLHLHHTELQLQTKVLSQELLTSRLQEDDLRDHLENSCMPSNQPYMSLVRSADLSQQQDRRMETEMARLHHCIDGQQADIKRLGREARGTANRTISQCWQETVDEAVARERTRDHILVATLAREIEGLRAENCRLILRRARAGTSASTQKPC